MLIYVVRLCHEYSVNQVIVCKIILKCFANWARGRRPFHSATANGLAMPLVKRILRCRSMDLKRPGRRCDIYRVVYPPFVSASKLE